MIIRDGSNVWAKIERSVEINSFVLAGMVERERMMNRFAEMVDGVEALSNVQCQKKSWIQTRKIGQAVSVVL